MKKRKIGVIERGGKRPIDKQLKTVSVTSGNLVTLYTCTFPCTLSGLRWKFWLGPGTGTSQYKGKWLIIVRPDGSSIGSIDFINGNTTYQPEQNVLIFADWGFGQENNSGSYTGTRYQHFEGSSKIQRKLQTGDTLLAYPQHDSSSTTVDFQGTIQFFIKV